MAEKKVTTKKVVAKKDSPQPKAGQPRAEKTEKAVKAAAPKAVKAAKKTVSLDATIYSQKGTSAGTIALPESIFGLKWNNDLVHQVVVGQMSNKRTGTAHTKDRGEVSGGGKKPWKQKGTGRARHGSSRSPIWVHGGTTFGPRSEKDYSKKINRKMATKALFTILSRKYADGKILLVDSLSIAAPKTKDAAAILASLSKVSGFEKVSSGKRTAALIAVAEKSPSITKSFANLPGATIVTLSDISALSIFHANHILIVDPKKAIESLSAKMK